MSWLAGEWRVCVAPHDALYGNAKACQVRQVLDAIARREAEMDEDSEDDA
jgi:hypothetical protein